MGTYVEIDIDDVVIPNNKQEGLKQALLQLKPCGWCDPIKEEMTLQEIIKAWRYSSKEFELDGQSFGLQITAFDGEKWSNDDFFWNTVEEYADNSIDPYVEVKAHDETWCYEFGREG